MLKIAVEKDEDLQDALQVLISSMLPHENYQADYFSQNLHTILSYIKLEEFTMEYRLLMEALFHLNKIKISIIEFVPQLTRSVFESLLSVSVADAVINPDFGMKEWLIYEGQSSDLKIETVKMEACQKLYARAIALYDKSFELAQNSANAINHELELKFAFLSHVSTESINTQAAIVRHDARIGRKTLSGVMDWLTYASTMANEINNRITSADNDKTVCINSMESSLNLARELNKFNIPIGNFGIPEIDKFTPFLRHRLIVIVGKENIGKTKFAIDKAVNILLEGNRVAFMCGETQKSKVYADILINFIYKKYNVFVRLEHLACPEDCPEDICKIINMAIIALVDKKQLILCDAFNYESLHSDLVELYEKYKFDACFIDHSCALLGSTGDGSLKAKVDKLADDCKNFRKNYPVCIVVTSHPSTTAKDSDTRGKGTSDSPTKGSQNLSTDADDVYYLRDSESLRREGLVMLENTKRRDAGRLQDCVILRKRLDVSAFLYDENEQAIDGDLQLEKEMVFKELTEKYSGDDYTL